MKSFKRLIFLVLIALLSGTNNLNAQVFKWVNNMNSGQVIGLATDPNGNSSYIYNNGVVGQFDSEGNPIWNISRITYNCSGEGIAIDGKGNTSVTGFFNGIIVFDTTRLDCMSSQDIYVARLDPNGKCLWAKRAGGNIGNYAEGIRVTIDAKGNTYIIGDFSGIAIFDSIQLLSPGKHKIFFIVIVSLVILEVVELAGVLRR